MALSRALHPKDSVQRREVEVQGVKVVDQCAVNLDIDPNNQPLLALLCTLKSGKVVVLIASEKEILSVKIGEKIITKIATHHGTAEQGTLKVPSYMAGTRVDCYFVKKVQIVS